MLNLCTFLQTFQANLIGPCLYIYYEHLELNDFTLCNYLKYNWVFNYNLVLFLSVFRGHCRTHLALFCLIQFQTLNYNRAYLEESAKFTVPSLLLPSQPSWICCCRKISCPKRKHKVPTGFGSFQLSWSWSLLFWSLWRLLYASARFSMVGSAIFVAYKRYDFW